MPALKCKMCGGELAFEEGSTVCECEYCGSRQTIPTADNEKKTNLFNRANRLRMNAEFDKASAIYEQIAAEFPEEAEAYWGLCLCAYGIEYVDDPATGKRIPTCHRTLPASIMEDSNFEQACDYADTIARKVYRDEAKAIDRIQKDILAIVSSEQPYDVFICYKETAEEGGRTEDSVLGQDIYDALTAKGMKVFFSRITLEDKLGVQYEPYIYAALSSAKVMLAIGTQFEYYDAVWVKNEWSRFLAMTKADHSKTLIPCFKGLDAYDMPKEFKGLQAQDMGKLGWMQDLVRGVEKLCGKGTEAQVQQNIQQTVVQQVVQNGSNVENLMKRVYLFLEDGDFKQAEEYIGKVLDVNAEYAPAYVAKVLVQFGLKKEADLATLRKPIDDNTDWKKALRFADEQQKQIYEGYARTINGNQAEDEENARQARLKAEREAQEKENAEKYAPAVTAMNNRNYALAIITFNKLGDYKESRAYLRQCIDAYKPVLAARQAEKSKNDPQLVAAKNKVNQTEQTVKQEQSAVGTLEKEKTEAEKRIQSIPEEIRQLNNELSQVHGFFSGGKKKNLESQINALKEELSEITRKQRDCEATVEKKKISLNKAENELNAARSELESITEEIQRAESEAWTDEAVISAAAAEAERAKYDVGKTVTPGSYGNEAIKWIVLDAQGDSRLLISRYGLDTKPYNTEGVDVTWETCTLRKWLNGEFLNTAFDSRIQSAIQTTAVDNSKSQGNPSYSTDGGNNTQDKVFLLSYAEAKKYFATDEERRCAPTDYAVKQGASTSSSKKADGKAAGSWWLRSPGYYSSSASRVHTDGSFHSYDVSGTGGVIRPAFWLDLNELL